MENKPKILLVEDDENLGSALLEYLQVKGYDISHAKDGEQAYELFIESKFDLCLLDVMIPKLDGFSLADKIRKIDLDTPLIFLTAKSLGEDKLKGFDVGGDDYITKPFSADELLVRIKAILKRTYNPDEIMDGENEFKIGTFVFKSEEQKLIRQDGHEFKLTSKESALLRMLAVRKNQILDRSQALVKIWMKDDYFNARSMDVYITKLRKFLSTDENLKIINVHGKGFKLVELKGN